jgi:hypothetical protein
VTHSEIVRHGLVPPGQSKRRIRGDDRTLKARTGARPTRCLPGSSLPTGLGISRKIRIFL